MKLLFIIGHEFYTRTRPGLRRGPCCRSTRDAPQSTLLPLPKNPTSDLGYLTPNCWHPQFRFSKNFKPSLAPSVAPAGRYAVTFHIAVIYVRDGFLPDLRSALRASLPSYYCQLTQLSMCGQVSNIFVGAGVVESVLPSGECVTR